ncbi:hypothetical protein BJ994_002646 [Arthrobacter pigmenti]|uniref:Uracil-DNA glycosylase-like domain-containing protein n=1 Tax=Arthrobacter pigmenti TaxID=271432 RepID=A0A846RPS1_9MICC|nr:uracil-DNA glycosylase [Arthrobacter pigmenti]NJC23570.1 hypothetical protein [Arthrobacter pigmenti]
MFLDRPQALSDKAVLEGRRSQLATAPHIQSLEQWRADYVAARSLRIPHFDPDDAGDQARVLFVLDRPPEEVLSEQGSGFVSVDNPDSSAERCWIERDAAGLHNEVLMWNLVPFPASSPTADDRTAGAKALGSVLRLLPRLEVVLLCSDMVQQTWERHLRDRVPRVIAIKAPGVGPQALSRKTKQEELRKAVLRAKRLVG